MECMDIEVKMGDIALAKNADNLAASGIGSCVAIVLYDPKLKIGALAHAMLHHSPTPGHGSADTKYIDTAIDEMLKKMLTYGAKKQDTEAKIVGGANMFSILDSDIGKQNVLSAKEKLKKEGIKLAGECVGGSIGRSVEFCIATGIVTVKTKF